MPSHRIPFPDENIDLHPVGEEIITLTTDESNSESSESSEEIRNNENPFSEEEFNTAVGHAVHQYYRDIAIRDRGRGLGQGRGQNELLPRNELLRGQTFNGFAHNLEPEEITNHGIDQASGEMLFTVRWINHQGTRLIESSLMRQFRPDMVTEYLEAVIARLPDNDLNSVDQQD